MTQRIHHRTKERQARCIHVFVIGPPSGKQWVDGQCRKCGAHRQHRVSADPPSNPWRRTSSRKWR